MEPIDWAYLQTALRYAWSRETSSDPDRWSPNNPAWGQSDVSALVAQQWMSGDIKRVDVTLPDGSVIPHYHLVSQGRAHMIANPDFPIESEQATDTQCSEGYWQPPKMHIIPQFKVPDGVLPTTTDLLRFRTLSNRVANMITTLDGAIIAAEND